MKTTFNRLLAIILVSTASIQAAWELAPGSTILTIPTGVDATNVMTFEPLLSMFERYKCPNPESGSESDDSSTETSRPAKKARTEASKPVHEQHFITYLGETDTMGCDQCDEDWADIIVSILPRLRDGQFNNKHKTIDQSLPGYIKFIYSPNGERLTKLDSALILRAVCDNPNPTLGDLLVYCTIVIMNLSRRNADSIALCKIAELLYLTILATSISTIKNALLRTNAQAAYDLVPSTLIATKEVLVLVKKCIEEINALSLATSFSEIDQRISLNEPAIDTIKSVTINLLRSTFNEHLGRRVPEARCTENTRKACKFMFDYFGYGSIFFETPTKESVFNEFHPINPRLPLAPPILDEVD